MVNDIASSVFNKWKAAETQVLNPPVPRVPPTRESILRGRELFLGLNQTGNKVDCTSCHGPQAVGNGPSFVAQEVFNDVVFGGDPSTQDARLEKYDEKTREAWKQSLDDWGNPLRPNNLNRGVYKGGRRPIDLYWRIAKGINGAKMPAHDTRPRAGARSGTSSTSCSPCRTSPSCSKGRRSPATRPRPRPPPSPATRRTGSSRSDAGPKARVVRRPVHSHCIRIRARRRERFRA